MYVVSVNAIQDVQEQLTYFKSILFLCHMPESQIFGSEETMLEENFWEFASESCCNGCIKCNCKSSTFWGIIFQKISGKITKSAQEKNKKKQNTVWLAKMKP